jgi:hypothetical protein
VSDTAEAARVEAKEAMVRAMELMANHVLPVFA